MGDRARARADQFVDDAKLAEAVANDANHGCIHFGMHKGKRWAEIPGSYLFFLSRKFPDREIRRRALFEMKKRKGTVKSNKKPGTKDLVFRGVTCQLESAMTIDRARALRAERRLKRATGLDPWE